MRRPLFQSRTGQTDAGTAVEISLPQVKPGETWLIRGIHYSNNSGEAVTFQWGVLSGATFHCFQAADSVADGDGDYGTPYALLREGEAFAFRVKGTANKGAVFFQVSGEVLSEEPEEIVVVTQKPAG